MKKPFILQFAVPQRKCQEGVPYRYSPELNLNVIENNIPYVAASITHLELATRTDVAREAPDAADPNNILHLIDTVTKVDRESDRSLTAAIELDTESRVAREGSDSNRYAGLEFWTKTETQPERDD